MPTQTVSYLIDMMQTQNGQKGSVDTSMYWFENVYKLIREKRWLWNWTDKRAITKTLITSDTNLYTWNQGDSYLTCTATPTVTYAEVGRFVRLDKRNYRVYAVDTVFNRVYLDAPISEASVTTPVSLSFYRGDLRVNGSDIRSVFIDGLRVTSVNRPYFDENVTNRYKVFEAGRPRFYAADNTFKIPAPKYAPVKTASVAGRISPGTRHYFFTFYDSESGQESAPGPVLEVTNTVSENFTIQYDNINAANLSEGPGYTMRLYRSRDSPYDTERFPAYLISSKDPFSATPITDLNKDEEVRVNERYYAGNTTLIIFDRWPDEVLSLDINHLNDFGGRPEQDDRVEVGRNNVVQELIHIGALQFSSDVQAERNSAVRAFRSQMNYLLKTEIKPNDSDYSLQNTTTSDGIVNDDRTMSVIDTWQYNG